MLGDLEKKDWKQEWQASVKHMSIITRTKRKKKHMVNINKTEKNSVPGGSKILKVIIIPLLEFLRTDR